MATQATREITKALKKLFPALAPLRIKHLVLTLDAQLPPVFDLSIAAPELEEQSSSLDATPTLEDSPSSPVKMSFRLTKPDDHLITDLDSNKPNKPINVSGAPEDE